MTILEVLIAMSFVAFVCGGIYTAGITTLRLSQTNRISTEAQSFAIDGLEEYISQGYDSLAGGGGIGDAIRPADSMHHNVELVRTMSVIWHNADGTISASPVLVDGAYAEITSVVTFGIPGTSRTMSNRCSALLCNMVSIHENI